MPEADVNRSNKIEPNHTVSTPEPFIFLRHGTCHAPSTDTRPTRFVIGIFSTKQGAADEKRNFFVQVVIFHAEIKVESESASDRL